jgi:hypothetical protein
MGERISDLGASVVEEPEAAAQSMETAENAAAEQPSSHTFEEVVTEVEAYFGGRIFTFKSHTGTAAQIAEMCPMAKMAFHRGAEFAISFLEKFDGTPETKPKSEDEPVGDEGAERSDGARDATSEADTGTQRVIQEAAETKTDTAITIITMTQVAVSAVMRESAVYKSEPVTVKASKVEKRQVGDMVTPNVKDIGKVVAKKTQPKTEEPVHIDEAVPQEVQREVIVRDVAAPIKIESPPFVEKHDVPQVVAKREAIEPTKTDNAKVEMVKEFTEPPAANSDVYAQQPIEIQDTMDAEHDELEHETQESIDKSVFVAEDETQDEAATSSDMAAEEVGEESEETTDVYETVLDQLGIEHEAPAQPSDTIEQRDPETTTLTPLLEIIEEILDQPEEKQPLIKQHLVEVVRSIEILKWARSAEECREAVDGLKANLALLFEELGYDDAGLLAVQLLERYNLQSLDEVMNTALKIARSKASHAPRFTSVRHALIGRHVMKLLFGALPGNLSPRYLAAPVY